jgi:hypothetical protein
VIVLKVFHFVGGPLHGKELELPAPSFVWNVPVADPDWLARIRVGDTSVHPSWKVGKYERIGSHTMVWMGVK